MKNFNVKITIFLIAVFSSNAFGKMRLDSAKFEVYNSIMQCNECQADTNFGGKGLVTRYVLNGTIVVRQSDTEKYTSMTTKIPAYAKFESYGPILYGGLASGTYLNIINLAGKSFQTIFGTYQGVDLRVALVGGAQVSPAINENKVVIGFMGFYANAAGAVAQYRKFQLMPGEFKAGDVTQVSAGDIVIQQNGQVTKKSIDLKTILETKIQ